MSEPDDDMLIAGTEFAIADGRPRAAALG